VSALVSRVCRWHHVLCAGLTPRSADLRAETRAKFEHCLELPPLSGRQQATDSDAEVVRLRKEIEDAHKARSLWRW
jgi:hypothetical protein